MLNQIVLKTLPIVPKSIVFLFAKKYIAGLKLENAINETKKLMEIGGSSTIDVLGEFVTTRERAVHETDMCMEVLDAISEHKLSTYSSIKPTSLGLGIDFDFGYENISKLVAKAKSLGIFVRLDMENSPYTTMTLDLYKKLRDAGFDNVGIVIQSYMRRSMDDVRALIDYKPNIRLCKGIYVESEKIAYKGYEEVRQNFRDLLDLMLDNGLYVGIATHDEPLIEYGLEAVKKRNLKKEDYEFQMLLGVREKRRDEILQMGHNLRVYVPFGEDWYGYSTRRLKENPAMVGHIVKSILGLEK
ncbi:MAG: proline dehydrogenase family protein [Candidatus Kapabacteria bacterium]|nr:proline dehydrogenase family protein [Ignavibacteriota bacterium]MCW5883472.1 proline dehydrogenase family protein [Candidatus Kapabacteria bacterium]